METWKPSFALGIADIDEQHKGLFHVFDVLQQSLDQGYGADQLGVLFLEMLYYVRTHLRYEEGMLKRRGYPELEAHRQLHLELEERLHIYYTRYKQELKARDQIAQEVGKFMAEWLFDHIHREDRRYSDYLQGRGDR